MRTARTLRAVDPQCVTLLPPVFAVAYSAGRDSTALLHAAACSAAELGLRVVGLHVHHGLSPHADAWLAHAQAQVQGWAEAGLPVSLMMRHLHFKRIKGASLEALARQGRYAALAEMAQQAGTQLILLAHHRRDQAETFLLQALRGAGAAGLSAMPRIAERAGVVWARPWLERPRELIEAYLQQHRLSYIDDDSNEDPRLARNRLRLQVWPALEAAFADAQSSLADAAVRAQDAAAVLAEVAQQDLVTLGLEPTPAARSGFPARAWQELSEPRLRNALRVWFQAVAASSMPASLLTRLVTELPQTLSATWPAPGGALRLYRRQLRYVVQAPAALDVVTSTPSDARAGAGAAPGDPGRSARAVQISIGKPGRYPVPGWGGCLVVRAVPAAGVALARLHSLTLRERSGAEQFQSHAQGMPRSLKKQFQAAGVPAWDRGGPLLYCGDELIFVPGLGVDARAWASEGQIQVALNWVSDAYPSAD